MKQMGTHYRKLIVWLHHQFELPPKTDKIQEINVSHGKNKRMHVEINCKRYFLVYHVSMKFSTLNTLKGALKVMYGIITSKFSF